MFHRGEMIVPSQGGFADAFRGVLGAGAARAGSGGDMHIHVHAMDSQGRHARSVEQLASPSKSAGKALEQQPVAAAGVLR